MKVVLDVDKLLAEGRITATECARLKEFAFEDTGSLAFNILIGFGVVATAAGVLALLYSAAASIPLGLILAVAGGLLSAYHAQKWGLLGSILLLVGSITAAGGIIIFTGGNVVGFLLMTLLCLGGAVLTRSGLLVAMAVLALAATVGAATAYGHATYELIIRRPTVTVILFGVLSWGAYVVSLRLGGDYERLALVFARTSLLLVNLGFWVGSLWGDSLWYQRDVWNLRSGRVVPDWSFGAAWAIGLIATGIWAVRINRRWVVNLVAVFGAIHFYTQYFERLGASPGTILVAGLAALGIALIIVRYNQGGGGGQGSHVAPGPVRAAGGS
jgi:iron complex transport system permease protein